MCALLFLGSSKFYFLKKGSALRKASVYRGFEFRFLEKKVFKKSVSRHVFPLSEHDG